jgi:transcriptional regulator with XRE-family HTH domain
MDMTTVEAEVGAMLRRARLKRKMSCRDLAAQLGWDHSELSRIERGRVTSLSRYERIANELGKSLKITFRPIF